MSAAALSLATTPLPQLVRWTDPKFLLAAALVVIVPACWNFVARTEYRTHFLTKLFRGNKLYGCYFLAVCILAASRLREWRGYEAIATQPTLLELDNFYLRMAAGALFVIGFILVASSFYALGITGTFLGDYFGILMDSKVEGFPFDLISNPMYFGSTLMMVAGSIRSGSPAGLVLSALAAVVYYVAAKYWEEPFTNHIYAEASRHKRPAPERAAASPRRAGGLKSPARSPAAKSPGRTRSPAVKSPRRTQAEAKLDGKYWRKQ
jgi:methylene-fatty-acyl-phospholipid synthase